MHASQTVGPAKPGYSTGDRVGDDLVEEYQLYHDAMDAFIRLMKLTNELGDRVPGEASKAAEEMNYYLAEGGGWLVHVGDYIRGGHRHDAG